MKKHCAPLFFAAIALYANDPNEHSVRPPEGHILHSAQPYVQNEVIEPYIEASYIYFKIREDGLDYVQKGVGTVQNPVTSKGKVYESDFSFESGYQVGLGFNLGHDGWDLLLRYSWVSSHIQDTNRVDPFLEQLSPLWTNSFSDSFLGGVSKASSDWDFHFNTLDFEWGRNFYMSRHLTFRPFFGLKGFWINQDFQVKYEGFLDQARTNPAKNTIDASQDTWGIGVLFGTNTAWYFAKNWSVFADMALSLARTKFDLERKDKGVQSGVDTTLFHVDYDRYSMTPILNLTAGLRWEMWFNCDRHHFLIQTGWEELVFWNFNRLYKTSNPSGIMGNLEMQGLNLKFRFDF